MVNDNGTFKSRDFTIKGNEYTVIKSVGVEPKKWEKTIFKTIDTILNKTSGKKETKTRQQWYNILNKYDGI